MFSKTPFLAFQDITKPYNLPIHENISKIYKWKAKTTSKTQQLKILIRAEVNIYFNFFTKLVTVNRQTL